MNGLVPAIIQDADTAKVLMLGFMNREAYDKTVETGKVTFFSRTKNRLWTKGEESGNIIKLRKGAGAREARKTGSVREGTRNCDFERTKMSKRNLKKSLK